MEIYPNLRIPFGDILEAIEKKLVLDNVVGDPGQIAWGTPRNVPQFSGPFDILLIARNGHHDPYDGGPAQFPIRRYVDIFYRSQAVADSGGGYKEWIKSVFVAGDEIINSVANDNWWPTDIMENLLTVQSVKFIGDAPPDYITPGSVFGDYVCSIECIYFPAIDPTKMP